jgi:signal transduction histidine kinase
MVVLATALAGTSPAQDRPDPTLPLLGRIREIRILSQDEGARGYPVRIVGTVTLFEERRLNGLIVHDGESGQYVFPPHSSPTDATTWGTPLPGWNDLKRGDRIEIEGFTIRGGFAPNVYPQKIVKLGRGPLPKPKILPYSAMFTGRYDCDYAEIEGVVQRAWLSDPVNTLFAEIAIEGGVVRASFWDFRPEDSARLVDARIRLRANVGALFSQTGQLRGISMLAERTSDIEVIEPPPDPFALPIRSIRSIYEYSAGGEVNRRIRVRGTVTGQVVGRPVEVADFTTTSTLRYLRHVIYVRDETSGARIETEQDVPVRPGEIVDVAGFAAVSPGKPILRNAVVRRVGTGQEPSPTEVRPEAALTPDHDAELVVVQGQLLGIVDRPTERVLVLKAGATVFDAGLDSSQAGAGLDDLRPGSTLRAKGVYAYQAGSPPSFRLFLRAPGDVTLLAAAPWWTLRHSTVLLGLVALVAGVAAFWVRMTGAKERQQYQAILTERNRLARELHDTLEQGLAGITLQLEAVAGSLEGSPNTARQSLDVARQMLRYSLEEARRSVMDLRSQALESGDLAGALADMARQMTQRTHTRAEVRVEGTPRPLDASQEHHLLRIGLEALTNSLRHGGPRRIEILLRFGADATELIVRDDGAGFSVDDGVTRGGHFGLLGIRERVDKLGGILRIDSQPGEGTRLAVTAPFRPLARPS